MPDAQLRVAAHTYRCSAAVDIGGKVWEGQLLAEIDTPKLDQQLRQAQADLGAAEANERLALVATSVPRSRC
jgi:multidrug efflux pump subunit AcrA (membrane-fusion protein)